jgi:hypothetical protein
VVDIAYNEKTKQWDRLPNHPEYRQENNMETIHDLVTAQFNRLTPVADMADAQLKRGDIVGHSGGVVLEFSLNRARGDDSYSVWTALCLLPDNDYTPFVVWNVIARPEGFTAESGDYTRTLFEAITAFTKRSK